MAGAFRAVEASLPVCRFPSFLLSVWLFPFVWLLGEWCVMAGSGSDRRSYDINASADAQSNIQVVIGRLEEVIANRDRQVKTAMADFTADGVADEYHGKEQRWTNASNEVKSIIGLLKSTLEKNDGTAQSTIQRAKAAVNNIG
ncbi:hypothetical protein M2271_001192 [Streptomyces sp. LBL]|nr:hypothetical protein [Streptomyces sp. LBL]